MVDACYPSIAHIKAETGTGFNLDLRGLFSMMIFKNSKLFWAIISDHCLKSFNKLLSSIEQHSL